MSENEVEYITSPIVHDQFGKRNHLASKVSKINLLVGAFFISISAIFLLLGHESKVEELEKQIRAPRVHIAKLIKIPFYSSDEDVESAESKEQKKKRFKNSNQPRSSSDSFRFSGPQVVKRPMDYNIPTGAILTAKLLTGASDGFVKAVVLDATQSFVAENSILIGKGVTKGRRLYIKFSDLILPDGESMKVNALAADFSDKTPGLKGSLISNLGKRLLTSTGLNFLAGASEGLKNRQVVSGVQVESNSLNNAALNGTTTASLKLSQELLSDMKAKAPKVIVKARTKFYVLFQ